MYFGIWDMVDYETIWYRPCQFIEKRKEINNGWFVSKELEKMCYDILNGLNHLHCHKIAHRDLKVTRLSITTYPNSLKPQNILVTFSSDMSVHHLALCDFGTAAVFGDSTSLF